MKTLTTILTFLVLTLTSLSQNNWTYSFNSNSTASDVANHHAVDNQGNIYITGQTTYQGNRGVLVKMSPTGYVVWVQYFTGYNGGFAAGHKVLIDQNNNIFVMAIGKSFGTSNDFYILKYDVNGNNLVSVRHGEPNYEEYFGDAIFDNSGNILVTVSSRTVSDSTSNSILLKYNSNCIIQQYHSYNVSASNITPRKLLKDLAGNIFVAANIYTPHISTHQVIIIKYNSQFQTNSSCFLGGTNEPNYFGAVELMLNTDIVAATTAYSSGQYTLKVWKLNNFFSTVWIKEVNVSSGKQEDPRDMQIDNNNNVYITGTLFGTSFDAQDAFTVKMNIDGNLQWSRIYDRAGFYDYASKVRVDAYGNVFSSGVSSSSSTNVDAMIIKYDSNGNLQFAYNYNGPAFDGDGIHSLEVTPAGIITACGYVRNYVGGNLNCDMFIVKLEGNFTGLSKTNQSIPDKFSLDQNYPNPFNPSTTIKFSIPDRVNVKLAVFNSAGQEVANLVNEEMNAGTYEYQFDASKLSSGVYFYKLITKGFSDTKKMILVK